MTNNINSRIILYDRKIKVNQCTRSDDCHMIKTISFINQKGGVGKSLLADELAFEFERNDIPYSFYDLDGQGGLIHEEVENKKAQYNIVDTPGQLTEDIGNCIKESDIIIVPTRASIKEMAPLERTLDLIKSSKKKKAAVIMVLNGWNRYTTYSQFESWLHDEYPEFNKIITLPQSEPLSQAGSYGKSVIDYKPRSKASEQLKKLWAVIGYELGMKL